MDFGRNRSRARGGFPLLPHSAGEIFDVHVPHHSPRNDSREAALYADLRAVETT